ncbi:SGNH/GDSL hydrolase family protein [Naasia sp. SYSU D00057]|uniref:SGNH/GDSL hydrolase family protein n=1 Tax=Naasia sp. SYSU D00057 TaxID=2817380 RepID=UPI001B30A819|nr:SGNH/GDSL hydrolase family protein [Naasia sp. SYSU D00057]
MFQNLRGRKGRLAGIAAAIPLSLGLLVGAAQPAAAHTPDEYVALGDSYTAGQGAGGEDPTCFRSPNGYPSHVSQLGYKVENRACQGTTTLGLLRSQLSGTPYWQVGLVSLTVGGNDAGFPLLGVKCQAELTALADPRVVPPPVSPGCAQLLDINRWETADLTVRLTGTYLAVRGAFPFARVVALGYPHLFPAGTDFTNRLHKAVDDLNSIIRNSAGKTGVRYASVTEAFDAHPTWISHAFGTLGFLHPTAEGYRDGYFGALRSVVGGPVPVG